MKRKEVPIVCVHIAKAQYRKQFCAVSSRLSLFIENILQHLTILKVDNESTDQGPVVQS